MSESILVSFDLSSVDIFINNILGYECIKAVNVCIKAASIHIYLYIYLYIRVNFTWVFHVNLFRSNLFNLN